MATHDELQALLDNGGTVRFPVGVHRVNAVKRLKVMKDRTRLLLDGVELVALPNSAPNYAILDVHANNCTITGGKLTGDRNSHTGTSGEWGMCLRIRGSNCLVQRTIVREAWGDGFYVGNGAENVKFVNVAAHHCRRQGMSLVSCSEVSVSGSVFTDTGGTAPEAGIDLEPDKTTKVMGVMIKDCHFENNKRCGIMLNGGGGPIKDVTVIRCTYKNNRPIKTKHVNVPSKYQPSWLAEILGLFGIWTQHPKELRMI